MSVEIVSPKEAFKRNGVDLSNSPPVNNDCCVPTTPAPTTPAPTTTAFNEPTTTEAPTTTCHPTTTEYVEPTTTCHPTTTCKAEK